jgi:hypothetical protein
MGGGARETSGSLRVREGMHAEKIAAPHSIQGKVRVRGLCLPAFRRRIAPPSIGEPPCGKFPAARSRSRTGRRIRGLAPAPHTNPGHQTAWTRRRAARPPLRNRSGTGPLRRASSSTTERSRDTVAGLAFAYHGQGFARPALTGGREPVVAHTLHAGLSGSRAHGAGPTRAKQRAGTRLVRVANLADAHRLDALVANARSARGAFHREPASLPGLRRRLARPANTVGSKEAGLGCALVPRNASCPLGKASPGNPTQRIVPP